ncbi:Eco57I restriction-modification methylase domain-containing protein [Reichenbachiella ulvae]|uniref:site-specific DNA-methyltransferase (adenine-specific) n=1 Tax=Reichenbachiella ulvae TaxID=2980104 RepID=A0ABT3CWU4_9BACT|nr:TaqI-like C-terminal specificity domain-containing protein [Reichenbachiella ulvae]MCV9388072.1 Eco57I restriction-modification methylase domain-containing protein [Reichenbachiella ulvae]
MIDLLSSPYNKQSFIDKLILPVFQGKVDSLVIYDESRVEEVLLTDGEEAIAESIIKYGEIITSDKRTIDLFEVTLQDSKVIERNKVSVGNIVKKHIIGNNAVFASFAYADATDRNWRFSFIAFDSQFEDGDVVQIETNPKRYTYVLGPGETCRTATDRFTYLAAKSSIDLAHIKEAFNVEKISKDFFNDYREHYQNFCEYLTGKRMVTVKGKQVEKKTGEASPFLASAFDGNEKFARDFAKKLMGRVVFLYFIQKKGWMGASTLAYEDGNLNFMQDFFEVSGKTEDFYPEYLSKLFFDTLNNPDRKEDSFTMPDGNKIKIPYLNGGLFEQESDAYADIKFPSALFEELFELFNQYNFTIYEDSPEDHTVAVDPEMLGHIFENLLEDNKDKGAFYTPKQIVHYMTQESLMEYLLTHLSNLSRKDLEPFIKDKVSNGLKPDKLKEIGQLLNKVKICDPAIGSGAFPMGLLQEIFSLKELIAFETDQNWQPAKVKTDIIQNSIYGVDLEKGAVDIARLRFWLSLVVDELTPKPLPNLDYKIMQGNSLLESYEGIPLNNLMKPYTISYVEEDGQASLYGNTKVKEQHHLSTENQQKLEALVHEYFACTTPARKQEIKEEIDQLVHEHIEYNIGLEESKITISIAETEARLVSIKIDPKTSPAVQKKAKTKKEKEERLLQKLYQEQAKFQVIKEKLVEEEKSREKNYFLWHLYFKEVFDTGGFDIVIGNPPYVQIQKMGKEADLIKASNFDTFNRTGDVYCIFFELGNKLLKEVKGNLIYITSNSWLRANYGKILRRYFIDETSPLCLIDLSDSDIFETATVRTAIFQFKKTKSNRVLNALRITRKKNVSLDQFDVYVGQNIVDIQNLNDNAWTVTDKQSQLIIDKVRSKGKILDEWCIDINYGIKTGLNDAFWIDGETRKSIIEQSPKEASIIKPMLRGRDVNRYQVNFNNSYLINTHNGIKKKDLPRINVEQDFPLIYKHLQKWEKELIARADQGDHWSNLRNCAYLQQFENAKIIYPNMSSEIAFSYDDTGFYTNQKCYILTGEKLKYLLAILNSKLFKFCFEEEFPEVQGNAREINKVVFKTLPILYPNDQEEVVFEPLVNQILSDKSEGKNTSSLEQEIDAMVFKLYELTYEEVLEVLHNTNPDGEFWMSKEEYNNYKLN